MAPHTNDQESSHGELPCQELTTGEARYLLALQDLGRTDARTTQAAVARKLGVSKPTTLEMIRRLRALDLVAPDGLALTARGVSAALVLSSRRHAAQVLAQEVLGLDETEAKNEAETLAVQLSPMLARRLIAWAVARD